MIHTLVILCVMSSPAQPGRCLCTPPCSCGCQDGKDCTCLHDGKKLPPREKPKDGVAPAQPAGGETLYPIDRDGLANFGIDTSRISKTPRYRLSGQEGTREIGYQQMLNIIQDGVPDDRNKLRLTIIGPEEDRKRVLADLAGPLAEFKNLCVVQGYAPDSPIINSLGFITTGRPTIYIQRPDGVVLHRQDDYNGPQILAGALRRSDPNYDPNKDPDLSRPKPPPGPPAPQPGPGPDLSRVPMWAWLLLGVGAFILLSGGDKKGKGD